MPSLTAADTTFDPITFEVLRHKLDEIAAEAFYTIGRVSGSPVVYEAGDHQEAICTSSGEMATFGAGVLTWGRSISAGVQHVLGRYMDNPGIAEDDQFLVNDPYVAAVHGPDVQLLAPVFWEGELVAWAGSASHQADIGGLNHGSLCVDAHECFQEGFLTPGIKFVDRGVVRRDVEDTFRNMVRAPELGLLDIRAKIASNNVIKTRLHEMIERYGVETVKALFEQLLSYSEGRLRAKLQTLEDGTWTAAAYVEGIANDYIKVQVAATKTGDSITFDFTGSSPQTTGSENIGAVGTRSSTLAPLISILCHDLPWNSGLFRPVEFVLPEGTVVNPRRPTALSASVPSGANVAVVAATQGALAKMLLASEDLRSDAPANIAVGRNDLVLAAQDGEGGFIMTLVLDGLASGVGAMHDRDGENTAQNPWAVKTMIGNVESTEMAFPILYLWRKEVTDSGGAGRHRGGAGNANAMIPWGVDALTVVHVGCGHDPRSCSGLAGGYPAPNTPLRVIRGADVPTMFNNGRLPTRATLEGTEERPPPNGAVVLTPGDAIYGYAGSGGGGFGDPLERDVEAVLGDISRGYVSRDAAESVYGVVLTTDGASVDMKSTHERRSSVRAERMNKISRGDDATSA